jgi:hypothetical protein
MIYIPFKDLVVRYAFVIVLAKHLDKSLSAQCFANRRAEGQPAKKYLLDDYYKVSFVNLTNGYLSSSSGAIANSTSPVSSSSNRTGLTITSTFSFINPADSKLMKYSSSSADSV